jgi:hypothetical protein
LTAARSLDAAAAAAAGVFPAADGLTDGAAAAAGALGTVLAVAAAAARSLATGLPTAPGTALDTAVGTVTCPVFAALPWLEQPVANVTRSVTPATAAAAELDRAGVRRLTPVPS